jgi:signal transduction histidine kinase
MVPNTLADERFATNPLVTGSPKIRFYAGVPLVNPAGLSLGTLCVIDYVPRSLNEKQQEALKILARQVVTQLELRRHVKSLNQAIAERQQAEAEVLKALAKEQELNELKSRFVSMTSHEFRTPLATILLSAELLEHYSHKWTEERKTAHFQRIQTAVQQMTELMNDVLLIGTTEAQKLQCSVTPIDLAAFCHILIEEIKLSTGTQHTINFHPPSSCCPVCLDEKLLRPILSNLLINAIKYSPAESTIQFDLVYHQDEIVFQIQDQGIGIPPEDQPHLFESFHRATNVGTISGTGLGLTIVKRCVDLHAGQVVVNSEVGVGTTFTIKLPLIETR